MNGTQQRPPSRHTPRGCWVMRRARVPEIANPPSLFNPPLQVNFLLLSRILKNKTYVHKWLLPACVSFNLCNRVNHHVPLVTTGAPEGVTGQVVSISLFSHSTALEQRASMTSESAKVSTLRNKNLCTGDTSSVPSKSILLGSLYLETAPDPTSLGLIP